MHVMYTCTFVYACNGFAMWFHRRRVHAWRERYETVVLHTFLLNTTVRVMLACVQVQLCVKWSFLQCNNMSILFWFATFHEIPLFSSKNVHQGLWYSDKFSFLPIYMYADTIIYFIENSTYLITLNKENCFTIYSVRIDALQTIGKNGIIYIGLKWILQ